MSRPGEPRPQQRKLHKQVRHWTDQYALLVGEIDMWARGATDEEVQAMLDQCSLYGQTNCWYMDYETTNLLIVPTLKAEVVRRRAVVVLAEKAQ